jgi:hypothetical protein
MSRVSTARLSPYGSRSLPTGPATIDHAAPPMIAPAATRLLAAKSGPEAMAIMDSIPASLWGFTAAFVARRTVYAPEVVKTALQMAGIDALRRAVGAQAAGAIFARYGL